MTPRGGGAARRARERRAAEARGLAGPPARSRALDRRSRLEMAPERGAQHPLAQHVARAFSPRSWTSLSPASPGSDALACPAPPCPSPEPVEGTFSDALASAIRAPCSTPVCTPRTRARVPQAAPAAPRPPSLLAAAGPLFVEDAETARRVGSPDGGGKGKLLDRCRSRRGAPASGIAAQVPHDDSPDEGSVSPHGPAPPRSSADASVPALPVSVQPLWSLEPHREAPIAEVLEAGLAPLLSSRRRSRSLPYLPWRTEASRELSFALGGGARSDSDAEDAIRVEAEEPFVASGSGRLARRPDDGSRTSRRRDTPHPTRDVLFRGAAATGEPSSGRESEDDSARGATRAGSSEAAPAASKPGPLASPFSVADQAPSGPALTSCPARIATLRRTSAGRAGAHLDELPSSATASPPRPATPKSGRRIAVICEAPPGVAGRSPAARAKDRSASPSHAPRSPDPEERPRRRSARDAFFDAQLDAVSSASAAALELEASGEASPVDGGAEEGLGAAKHPGSEPASVGNRERTGAPMSQMFVDGIPLVTFSPPALTSSGPLAI